LQHITFYLLLTIINMVIKINVWFKVVFVLFFLCFHFEYSSSNQILELEDKYFLYVLFNQFLIIGYRNWSSKAYHNTEN